MIILMTICGLSIDTYVNDKHFYKNRLNDMYEDTNMAVYLFFSCVELCVNLAFLMINSCLIAYHI